jgi:MFS transporter, OPA family, glycerol-3-phosphate transporter
MPEWLSKSLPIFLLLVAIGIVVSRLPKVDMGHSEAFKRRRVLNWLPLGMTYAFLYFGRYNLAAINSLLDREHLLSKKQFGDIDGIGQIVYGVAFLLNGPLTDLWGGRVTIMIATAGSCAMNLVMAWAMHGVTTHAMSTEEFLRVMTYANAANMYFPELWCGFDCEGQCTMVSRA